MKVLSLLFIEDSVLFRSALANMFAQKRVIDVTTCSSSGVPHRRDVGRHDAVVIDTVTWTAGAQSLAEAIEAISREVPVIILVREELQEGHLDALQRGAMGFVKQTASLQVLVRAIRAVCKGEIWLDKELFRKLVLNLPNKDVKALRLAPRDERVLHLISRGKTNKEISAALGFSERIVKARISNLFRITGVRNRSGLAVYAITRGPVLPIDEPA